MRIKTLANYQLIFQSLYKKKQRKFFKVFLYPNFMSFVSYVNKITNTNVYLDFFEFLFFIGCFHFLCQNLTF